MEAMVSKNNPITLEKGKTYHLVVGIHVGGCGDVMYLSNMLCKSVTEGGYTLQGVPGTVGSLRGPINVYRDEVFAVFDKDLFECLVH